ncbi:hypothetical protein DPEC_G00050730 [Dallia pectoralis]|uniref:Uncharacterized protein n=1 Tax=Dallia pectoralis TaxID=75939 RepID=A0ACC2HCI4_DALPE|nr:hypothetical protein DPEC_G00050730 [Dallia pectoralis]
MASPPNPGEGQVLPGANINQHHSSSKIKKCGYLRKQKHGHKRFFVLREPTEGFPARLEYYESEKKWRNKSAAAKRVIPLDCCLNINKRADAKHKHLIALYTKDEYFAVAAESEQEQENWFRVLTELMSEGRAVHSDGSASNSASSLVGFDEGNYGMITPVTAAYKEVWQVNLKSKGLGQCRNMTGVYRLCLSGRTISFVKLNSDVASVILQLMNIRRCGHSESFFFIEVGRSAATGPGELWMQADDSVVAQNIHETILEAMKALKELSEFRPRSKSQSSGTNPISVPTRRHHNNLPPSQTGLQRRSRTDSMATTTSPVSKITHSSCRIRTASEGDGTMARPMSVNGSPLSPGVHRTLLGRSNTLTARPCRTFESSLHHGKSMSMPLSHSPPTATHSPVSLSSCSESSVPRPSSSASVSGSLSDGGFTSCEEYGSSPAVLQLTLRSNTPESLSADTPPSRDGSGDLHGYMVMERQTQSGYRRLSEMDKGFRKRTYSLTTPRRYMASPQVSSTSLDEYTLMRATHTGGSQLGHSSQTASPQATYPEGYGDVRIGSNSQSGDSGYMPMTPGVAAQMSRVKGDAYMPMSPMCVSAPKQIVNPRPMLSPTGLGHRTHSPDSVSLEENGYMKMFCGAKMSVDSTDGKLTNGDYLNMSPVDPLVPLSPSDYILSEPCQRQPYSFSPMPRPLKAPPQRNGVTDTEPYVVMTLQRQRIDEESNHCPASPVPAVTPPSSAPSPVRAGRVTQEGGVVHRGRVNRPTRLALDSLRTLPFMSEHPLPTEPRSPGEYINIDFGRATRHPPATSAADRSGSSPGSVGGSTSPRPLSDYVNIDVSLGSAEHGDSSSALRACPSAHHREEDRERGMVEEEKRRREAEQAEIAVGYPLQKHGGSACPAGTVKDDYTEMTFSPTAPSAPLPGAPCPSDITKAMPGGPSDCIQRLSLGAESAIGVPPGPVESFFVGGPALSIPPVNPDRGAKVIRADPQGRRRHSSETFSSTTTVTPVCPSFAHDANKRHSSASVENVSRPVRSSDGSDEEYGNGSSPMCRQTSAGYQNGLNYIALNLMEGSLGNCTSLGGCEGLLRFKTACGCKGGMNGFNPSPYTNMGFNETATAVKD